MTALQHADTLVAEPARWVRERQIGVVDHAHPAHESAVRIDDRQRDDPAFVPDTIAVAVTVDRSDDRVGPAHRNEKRPGLSSIQVPCSFENTFAAESMSTRRRSSVSARGGPPIPFPSIANEPLQVPCTPQESPVDAGPECRAEAHEKRRTSARNGAKP